MVVLSVNVTKQWKGQITMSDNNLGQSLHRDEEATELHEVEFSAWAIRRTRTRGLFMLHDAVPPEIELSTRIIETVVAKLLGRGDLEVAGDELLRWTSVPPVPEPRPKGSKRPYTVEERADSIRAFEAWAATATEKFGKFTEIRAIRESGLPSTAVMRAMGLLLDAGRVIKLEGGAGYRLAGVEVASSLSARRQFSRYSPDEWEELRQQVKRWSASFECFSANEVCKEFGIGATTAARLLKEFLADGSLVKLDYQRGYAWLGRMQPAGSLRDIIDAGREVVTTGKAGRRGRLRKDEAPDVTSISKSQFTKLTTLANFIAKQLGYRAPAEVPLTHEVFEWNSDSSDRGLVRAVREWTDDLPKDSREALRSSVGLLLAIGEAHDHLVRRSPASFNRTHAAEWQKHIDRIAPALTAANNGKCEGSLVTGLRVIAGYASRRGELDPDAVNWPAVHAEIDRDYDLGLLTKHAWTYARRAYEGMRELELTAGTPWVQREDRIALLPDRACQAAAQSLDFTAWVDADGRSLKVVEGLLEYCRWATLEPWELTSAGLPPREYVDPNPAQQNLAARNARLGKEDFRLAPATLLTRLQHVNYFMGWLKLSGERADVNSMSLAELCDVSLVTKLAGWLRERDGIKEGYHPMVRAIAQELAVIASPFLEARARQLSPNAPDEASELRRRAVALRQLGVTAKKKGIRKKDIKKIARAWRGRDQVDGWIKLLRLRNAIVTDIERLAGATLAEQVSLLEMGALNVTPEWALKVRSAVLVNLVRLIPLRRRTVSELTLEMWENEPVLPEQHGRALERWEGAIILNIPGRLMKSGRSFDPAYIAESSVGKARWENGAARDLLALWFMAGGARDELRRLPDGKLVESSFIFPALARAALNGAGDAIEKVVARECQWEAEDISEHFAGLVTTYAGELEVDIALLTKLGGLRLHIVRLLFGSYWAPRRLLMASQLLDHRSVTFTAKVYCGDGVRQATREVPDGREHARPGMLDASQPGRARSLLEQLADATHRAEVAEQHLNALRARAQRVA